MKSSTKPVYPAGNLVSPRKYPQERIPYTSMLDIGFQELILIFIVALLVVGPEKLPEFSRKLGAWVNQIRSGINEVKKNMEDEFKGLEQKSSDDAGGLVRNADTGPAPGEDGPSHDAALEGKGES
jgi:Tat protein translocase TatB subunit